MDKNLIRHVTLNKSAKQGEVQKQNGTVGVNEATTRGERSSYYPSLPDATPIGVTE